MNDAARMRQGLETGGWRELEDSKAAHDGVVVSLRSLTPLKDTDGAAKPPALPR